MNFTTGFRKNSISLLMVAIAAILLLNFPASIAAQTDDIAQMRAKASELLKANKYTEALPIVEKLAKATPGDPDVLFYLGFCLLGQSRTITDAAEAKSLRARARAAFVKSKEAGSDQSVLAGLIDSIPPDGGAEPGFSSIPQANKLMEDGEAAFSSGKMDEALAAYQSALKLDPKLYHAALFAGDVYMQQEKYGDAEIWYQKAIAIDPNTETAYRYSATPLMKQGKTDQARDRYIEAYIVEPYSRMAISGITQWGQITKTKLGHPKIDIPEIKVGPDGKVKTTINLGTDDDGSMAWAAYTMTRSQWMSDKFKKTYPAEPAYRHSLKEEAEALRSVIVIVRQNKAKTKNLNPQLATLVKMDDDGVLEAFILMAIPDDGIARDHADYLKSNRDKLRLYVSKYVIGERE